MATNDQIKQQALSGLPFDQLSPEAQAYRSTGQLSPVTQVVSPTNTLTSNLPQDSQIGQIGIQPQLQQNLTPTGQIEANTGVLQPQSGIAQPQTNSIVDFLKQTGQPFDFSSRARLAAQAGITDYQGTAQQNLQLLNQLKQKKPVTPSQQPRQSQQQESAPLSGGGPKIGGEISSPIGTDTDFTEGDPLLSQALKIAQAFGITPGDGNKSPQSSWQDYYKQAYSTLGLDTVKSRIDDLNKKYLDFQKEENEAKQQITDNPWMVQSVRDANLRKIEDKLANRKNLLIQELQLNQSIYESSRQDAIHAADRTLQLSHQGQELNKDVAFKLLDLAEKEVEARSKLQGQFGLAAFKEGLSEQLAQRRQDIKINIIPGGGSKLSPGGLDLAAQQYLTTGVMPPLGIGSTVLRKQIIERAAQLVQEQGLSNLDVFAGQAGFQANKTALAQLTKQKNIILAFETTANRNLDIVRNLSGKVGRTGSPVINRWLLAGRRSIAGDTDVARFDAAVRTAINEYARVVSSVTGGGVTSDTARKEVEALLNTAQTKDQIIGVIQTLKQEMENRRIGYELQEKDIRSQLRGGSSQKTPDQVISSGQTKSGLGYKILQSP